MQNIARNLYNDSYIQIGNIMVNDNSIDAGGIGHGINLVQWRWNAFNMYHNASAVFGNLEFQRNLIEANGAGIFGDDLTEWGYLMFDNSSAVFGDFILNENSINATGDGIYINLNYFGSNLNDYSSSSMDYWRLNNNTIKADGNGIYLLTKYFGYNINDYSISMIGTNEIMNNDVNSSGSYGIFSSWWNFFAVDLYDYSQVEVGDCQFKYNTVWMNGTSGVAIKCEPIWTGYIVDDNSSTIIGDYIVSNNWVYTEYDGIWIHFDGLGGNLENSNLLYTYAIAEIGNILVNNNAVIAPNYRGMTIYYYNVAEALYYYSKSTVGFCQIRNNTIDSYNEALSIELKWEGYFIYDSAQGSIGRFEVDENNLNSTNGIGIYIAMRECFNTIRGSSQFSWEGIYITNNDITAMGEGIDIFIEASVDVSGSAIVDFPGLWVTGNTVDSQLNAFNYTTSATPIALGPAATLDWGDVMIENNTFDGGLFGMAFEWQDPNASIPPPMFFINNCDIFGGLINSTGLFLFNIADFYAETVTIDGFDYGIYTNNSIVHFMFNSTITNSIGWDINMTSASYLFLVNSTFDNASVFFEEFDSLLEVGWFMNVLVQNQFALPVPDAIVAVADVDGTEVFNSTTNANGQVFYIICREYQENITGIIKNYNDYTANATKGVDFDIASPNPTMNQTRLVIITFTDVTPPNIFADNSDTEGTTGDPFYFEINATDNIGIVSVRVYFRYGGVGNYTNQTMSGTGPYWFTEILPTDYEGFIEYYFAAEDSSGLLKNTTPTTAPITDDDSPTIISDNSDTVATTGETFNFIVDTTDNINISEVHVVWWFGSDPQTDNNMSGVGPYVFNIPVPPDSLDTLHYYFRIVDGSGNWVVGPQVNITVTDNDEPTYTWILEHTTGNAGDSITVSLQAFDNIGITNYTINVNGTVYDMIKDGDFYNFTIDIPLNATEDFTYFVTLQDDATNSNTTTATTVTTVVPDFEPPMFVWVLRPMNGTTGDPVIVSLIATDNIGITYYKIEIDGMMYDLTKDGDFYNLTIDIPLNSTAGITYTVYFNDTANNPNSSLATVITVTDDDAPKSQPMPTPVIQLL
jgi:hypothetical protein